MSLMSNVNPRVLEDFLLPETAAQDANHVDIVMAHIDLESLVSNKKL